LEQAGVLRRGGGRTLSCALVAAATALVHASMSTPSAASSGRISVPTPERARALSFGFEPVIADYYWIQALQVVGDAERPAHRNETVAALIDLVTGLDPWVDHPYRFAALWLTENEAEVRHANHLLEKGIAYHPLDWRNRFYLGYNLFFYLEDNAQAADALESALAFSDAPDYLGSFVTRLRASGDGLDTAVLFLQQLLAQTEDEYARAEYLAILDEIETEQRARLLDRARAEFQRRNGRDIAAPGELWNGPLRVLSGAPPAHPQIAGQRWVIDRASGEIVSAYYGRRYRVHTSPADEAEKRVWREKSSAGATPAAPEARS
jgi:tetratricopeptide (TPR) repeat protein